MHISKGYCTLINKNERFIVKVKETHTHLFPLKVQHKELSCLSSFIPNDDWL